MVNFHASAVDKKLREGAIASLSISFFRSCVVIGMGTTPWDSCQVADCHSMGIDGGQEGRQCRHRVHIKRNPRNDTSGGDLFFSHTLWIRIRRVNGMTGISCVSCGTGSTSLRKENLGFTRDDIDLTIASISCAIEAVNEVSTVS